MRFTFLLFALTCAQASGLDKLAFMAGCWSGPGLEEHWMKPSAGTMMGMARTIKGDKTVMTEYHLIREEGGVPVMNIQLKLATKVTQFRLTESKAGEAVFSNPEHDFPQHIIYRSTPGGLFARIEGTVQGHVKSHDYVMKRCQ